MFLFSLIPLLVLFQPFDDVQYSEVRKGPLYVPGTSDTSTSPLPTSPTPLSNPHRDSLGASAGLLELDSLLEMLSETQDKVDRGQCLVLLVSRMLVIVCASCDKKLMSPLPMATSCNRNMRVV